MTGKASALPDVASAPMASSVSEYASLANLATASSKGPARAECAKPASNKTASAIARRRSTAWLSTGRPRRKWKKAATLAALFCRFFITRGSGTLTAALVGLGIVVAALLADPVADQVLGAVELFRPCIAGNQTRGLPHHVELAVRLDFADEHRLGDVMVRKHLGGAAG